MDLATLEQQALALSAEERAVLAQHLLASLDQDEGIEEAWAAEVERRVAEVESGAVQLIPLAEALAQVGRRGSIFDIPSHDSGSLIEGWTRDEIFDEMLGS